MRKKSSKRSSCKRTSRWKHDDFTTTNNFVESVPLRTIARNGFQIAIIPVKQLQGMVSNLQQIAEIMYNMEYVKNVDEFIAAKAIAIAKENGERYSMINNN